MAQRLVVVVVVGKSSWQVRQVQGEEGAAMMPWWW
jgi:hypothetical protein